MSSKKCSTYGPAVITSYLANVALWGYSQLARLRAFDWLVMSVIALLSLAYRAVLSYSQVFTSVGVKFGTPDAYYQLRLIDSIAYNFPWLLGYDPLMSYPSSYGPIGFKLFNYLPAAMSWLLSLGHPTLSTIDVVSAWYPAVLGALVVIPVYLLGRELSSRTGGVVAAILVSFLPSEFLNRSMLGMTDYHVAEVLLSSLALLYLIRAIKGVGRYSWIVSGIWLALYLMVWPGGVLFVAIIGAFCLLSRTSSIVVFKVLMMAAVVATPILVFGDLYLLAVVYATAAVVAALMLLPPKFATIASGVLVVACAAFVWGRITFIFTMDVGAITTIEMHHAFISQWWTNFRFSAFIAMVGLLTVVVGRLRRHLGNEWLLVLVWAVAMLVLTVMQQRFAYYAVVVIGVFVGYIVYLLRSRHVVVVGIVMLLFVSLLMPPQFVADTPSDSWMRTLYWIRDNTPTPGVLYETAYRTTTNATYGIVSWWDYGYEITRVSQRAPIANPSQHLDAIVEVAHILLSTGAPDVTSTPYIIIDEAMTTVKFASIVARMSGSIEQYIVGGQFLDAYYDTLMVRLYNGVMVEGYELVYHDGDVKVFRYR